MRDCVSSVLPLYTVDIFQLDTNLKMLQLELRKSLTLVMGQRLSGSVSKHPRVMMTPTASGISSGLLMVYPGL